MTLMWYLDPLSPHQLKRHEYKKKRCQSQNFLDLIMQFIIMEKDSNQINTLWWNKEKGSRHTKELKKTSSWDTVGPVDAIFFKGHLMWLNLCARSKGLEEAVPCTSSTEHRSSRICSKVHRVLMISFRCWFSDSVRHILSRYTINCFKHQPNYFGFLLIFNAIPGTLK